MVLNCGTLCDDCFIGSPVWERDMSVDAYAAVVVIGWGRQAHGAPEN
jgi:flavin-dependent dehydrogenase